MPVKTTRIVAILASVGTAAAFAATVTAGPPGLCHAAEGWSRPLQFHPGSDHGVPAGPQAGHPVVGDMNKDGKPDIVLACGACCGDKPNADGGHVAVLLGNGKGGFERSTPMKIGPTALVVALADFNEDGALDVACGEHSSYQVTILLGDGKGGLNKGKGSTFMSREGKSAHTHSIASADLNGDKHADLVIGNANDGTLSVQLGDGKGGFAAASGSPFRAARHPYEGLRLVDVNADGKLDAVIPDVRGDACSVLYGDGRGALAIPAADKQIPLGVRPGYVAAGDVNGDGKLDIVATHDDVGLVHVMLGDGRGEFTAAPGSPVTLDQPFWGAELGDVDGDGKLDLALAGITKGQVVLMRGDGTGAFGKSRLSLPCGQQTCHLALADLTGDGKVDVLASNYKSGNVSVWVQR
jgi:hypothetical protein